MGRLEDTYRFERPILYRARSGQDLDEGRVADVGKIAEETTRRRQRHRAFRLESIDPEQMLDAELADCLGEQPTLALPGIADHQDGACAPPLSHDRRDEGDRLELGVASEEWPAHPDSLLPPYSDLPIEPSRTEQQPRQAATQPAWVRRWIDRGWVKLNDDWAKDRFEAFGQAAGQVQLFARALARQPAIPGGAEERRRRCRVEDRGRHSATDVQLLGAGDGERNDRRPGTEGNQRPTDAERSDAPGRTAHRSFGHLGEDAAIGDDRPRGGDVRLDADPAAPDGQ